MKSCFRAVFLKTTRKQKDLSIHPARANHLGAVEQLEAQYNFMAPGVGHIQIRGVVIIGVAYFHKVADVDAGHEGKCIFGTVGASKPEAVSIDGPQVGIYVVGLGEANFISTDGIRVRSCVGLILYPAVAKKCF